MFLQKSGVGQWEFFWSFERNKRAETHKTKRRVNFSSRVSANPALNNQPPEYTYCIFQESNIRQYQAGHE
jgi:hypothetical protein